MKCIIRTYLCLAAIAFVTGCASTPPWWRVDGPHERETYAVHLPQGWMMPSGADFLIITRDGMYLQNIYVERSNIRTPFRFTKKKLTAGMLPQEASEIFLDNAASSENISNFEILENKPAKVDGISAFRAVYSYKDKDKLKYKSVTYGFVREKTFYDISYTAAARYYFNKDVKTFDKFVQAFRLITPEWEVELPVEKPRNEERSILQGEATSRSSRLTRDIH